MRNTVAPEISAAPQPEVVAAFLARLVDLIDPLAEIAYRRVLCAEAYELGRAVGVEEGWAAAEEAAERDHQALSARVLAIADPSGPEAREDVARRVRAAEAGCRRDALDHWRKRWAELYRLSRVEKFIREAQAREPLKRDYAQTMALLLLGSRRAAA